MVNTLYNDNIDIWYHKWIKVTELTITDKNWKMFIQFNHNLISSDLSSYVKYTVLLIVWY